MNSLLKLLPTIIALSGDNEQVREQAVFAAWRAVAGERLAYNCVPFRLFQKQLIIAVPDRVWKKQMTKLIRELIPRLNAALGKSTVAVLEFRIDPTTVLQARAQTPPPYQFQHAQEIKAELLPAAERIRDEALREKFLSAAACYLERAGK